MLVGEWASKQSKQKNSDVLMIWKEVGAVPFSTIRQHVSSNSDRRSRSEVHNWLIRSEQFNQIALIVSTI